MGLKAVEGNSLACGTLYAATTPMQTQPGGGAQGARERPPAGTGRLGVPRALHVPHHHLGGAERQRCPLISANTSLAQGTGQANLPSPLQTGRRERRLRAGERLRHREQAHARAAGGTRVSRAKAAPIRTHQQNFEPQDNSYLRSWREGEFHCTRLYIPPWCGDGRPLSRQMGSAVRFRGPSLSPRTWAPGGSPPQVAPRPPQFLLWETVFCVSCCLL